jgi:hypothetical protein
VLHCAVPCSLVLCWAVLGCAVLCCAVLCWAVPCRAVTCCAALCCAPRRRLLHACCCAPRTCCSCLGWRPCLSVAPLLLLARTPQGPKPPLEDLCPYFLHAHPKSSHPTLNSTLYSNPALEPGLSQPHSPTHLRTPPTHPLTHSPIPPNTHHPPTRPYPPVFLPPRYGDPKLCTDKQDIAFAQRFQKECSLVFMEAGLAQLAVLGQVRVGGQG